MLLTLIFDNTAIWILYTAGSGQICTNWTEKNLPWTFPEIDGKQTNKAVCHAGFSTISLEKAWENNRMTIEFLNWHSRIYIYIWTILDQYQLQQRIWLPGVFTMSWASPGHVLPYNSCLPWHRSPKCSLCLSSIEWKPKKLATVSKQFLMQHLQLELLNKAWSATVPLQNALIEFRSRRSRLLWSC